MRFFLLGFMGAGKSYWGRLWSKQSHLEYYDLDEEIEKKAGSSVSMIFDELGEQRFRELEKETLHSFELKDQFILSCGGGTPCYFDNMAWMNAQGVTIYFKTDIPVLLARLKPEKRHRPLIRGLSDEELERYIENKLAERETYYRQATLILDPESVSHITFTEIVQRYV